MNNSVMRTTVGIILSVILLFFAFYLGANENFCTLKLNEKGDFLAGILAPLALLWLIIGYWQQGEELKNNTKELQEQKKEFKTQNNSIKKQIFENTFFQLLALHNEITKSISIETKENIKTGRDALKFYLELFIIKENNIEQLLSLGSPGTLEQYIENILYGYESVISDLDKEYRMFHEKYHHKIGHYFRNIYQILKFIDNYKKEEEREYKKLKKIEDLILLHEERKFYSNLLRAQLSSDELLFLFYNCSSSLGIKKFKPLIEEYEFLEHLPLYPILTKVDKIVFSQKAFGQNPSWIRYFDTKYKPNERVDDGRGDSPQL